MRLHQVKKLSHSKAITLQTEVATDRMEECIYKKSYKRLTSKIYEEDKET